MIIMKTILLNVITCLSLTMTQCKEPKEAIEVAFTTAKTNYGYVVDTSYVKLDKRRLVEAPFIHAMEYSMETSDFNNLKPVAREFVNFEISLEGDKINQIVSSNQIGGFINTILKAGNCNNVKLLRFKNNDDPNLTLYYLIGENTTDPKSIKANFYFYVRDGLIETISVF